MMDAILAWFDQDPGRYWWTAVAALSVAFFQLLWPLRKPDFQDQRGPDWAWCGLIFVLLVVGRWPSWFVTREFNPDESHFIAGALTLRHDPIFWRSVDGLTAGPLDFYALFPVGWIAGADTYFTARVTAALLLGGALAATHLSLSFTFGRQIARVATFGAVCLEALTRHHDLIHYSSELVAVFLLAIGFLAFSRWIENLGSGWAVIGGGCLSMIPLAKLQAAPIAAGLLLYWVLASAISGLRRGGGRSAVLVCAGAAIPWALVAIALTWYHLWGDAVTSYIRFNVVYTGASALSLAGVWTAAAESASWPGTLLGAWLGGTAACLVAAAILPHQWLPGQKCFTVRAGLVVALALAVIVLPHRPYLHYSQFAVLPLSLLLGAGLGSVWNRIARPSTRIAVLCGALLASCLPALVEAASAPVRFSGYLQAYQRLPQGRISQELLKFASPGEALAVWGWANQCYAESGFRQGTREANTTCQMQSSPYRSYFRERYLADLARNQPKLFMDAVAQGGFVYSDPRYRHEVLFPELGRYIAAHYTLKSDLGGVRIYVRNSSGPDTPAAPHS